MLAPPRPRIPVARALVGLMVGVFVADVLAGGDLMWGGGPLLERGAQYAPAIWAGEWWRLGTAVFLHAGLLHLFVNSFSLLALGQVLEPALGSRRFLLLLVVSGLVSGLATLAFVTDLPSVGASGAVFGLAGLLLADELTRRRLYRRMEVEGGPRLRPRASIIPILLVNLVLGALIPQINNYAHLGGLLAGFLLGTAWIERSLRHRGRSRLAYVALGVLIGALGVLGLRPVLTGEVAFSEGVEAAQAGEWERAHEAFSRAIARSGGRRADYFGQRAYVAARAGRYAAALGDANEALARDPENPGLRFLRASIHAGLGDGEAAAADARAACEAGLEAACRALRR